MNKHIKEMIQRNMLIGGKITTNNGFVMFERFPLEELEKLDESEIAFATQSMGRAVFTIDYNGKIRNYKGVDSHFNNDELSTIDLVCARTAYIPNPNKSYSESTYPINLVLFEGNRVDIRIRGASLLVNLVKEACINAKMQRDGVKRPEIVSVKEFPYKLAKNIGLPTKVEGSYEEFGAGYLEVDKERRENMRRIYGNSYVEDKIQGLRPENMSEYFKRMGVFETEQFRQFAEENGLTVEAFVNHVDKTYPLGQSYGQTERIVKNPFRIADLEYYVKKGDLEAIQNIVAFSEEIQGKSPIENEFARQMGINIANMFNCGWMCKNLDHRQDFTLAGEMCDDSYFQVDEQLQGIYERNEDDEGKTKILRNDVIRRLFSQIYFIGSNIKVLQDEMKLRGKTEEEIDSVMLEFVQSFAQNINFEEMGKKFSVEPEKIKSVFARMIGVPRDYAKIMASQSGKDGVIIDEAVLLAHMGNNEFYNELSTRLAQELNMDRSMLGESRDFLSSAIEVTKETDTITTGDVQDENNKVVDFVSKLRSGIKAPEEIAAETRKSGDDKVTSIGVQTQGKSEI